MNSPTKKNEVVSVIDSHLLFTLESGMEASTEVRQHCDRCCRDNDRDAKDFLIASIDEKLEQQLCENIDVKTCLFVDLWMNLHQFLLSA